jgi:hypothetical protein
MTTQHFHTPMGLSTKRPGIALQPIDGRALIERAPDRSSVVAEHAKLRR